MTNPTSVPQACTFLTKWTLAALTASTLIGGSLSAASTHMDNNTTIACLSKVDNWQPIASGIWTSSIGDTSKELRYSDLAAEAPQIDRINQLPAAAFPATTPRSPTPSTPTRRSWFVFPVSRMRPSMALAYNWTVSIRPARSSTSRPTLGPWSPSWPGTLLHSSHGYGVFFNTARYLNVHSKISNRKIPHTARLVD